MAFAASRGHRQRPQIVIAAGRLGRRRQGEPRSRSYPRRRASVRPVVPGGKAGRGRRCQAGGKADRRQTGGRQVAGGKAARKRKQGFVCMRNFTIQYISLLSPLCTPHCPRFVPGNHRPLTRMDAGFPVFVPASPPFSCFPGGRLCTWGTKKPPGRGGCGWLVPGFRRCAWAARSRLPRLAICPGSPPTRGAWRRVHQ